MAEHRRSAFAEQFIDDADLRAICSALLYYGRCDLAKARRLATFAANIRFQAACLDNVRHGLMILDEDRDGNPVFMLTDEGIRVAREERQNPALAVLLPEEAPT